MIGATIARRTKTLWWTIPEVKLMDGRARPIRQPLICLDPTSILALVATPDLLLIVPLRQPLVAPAGLEKRSSPGKPVAVPGTIKARSDGWTVSS